MMLVMRPFSNLIDSSDGHGNRLSAQAPPVKLTIGRLERKRLEVYAPERSAPGKDNLQM